MRLITIRPCVVMSVLDVQKDHKVF